MSEGKRGSAPAPQKAGYPVATNVECANEPRRFSCSLDSAEESLVQAKKAHAWLTMHGSGYNLASQPQRGSAIRDGLIELMPWNRAGCLLADGVNGILAAQGTGE